MNTISTVMRSLATIFIVASSFLLATGQTPDTAKEDADKTAKSTSGTQIQKHDISFPGGFSLKLLIEELAREMDLNVVFDPESKLDNRTVKIELKNVTVAEALNYVLQQQQLFSEEAGPKLILVASRSRGTSIPKIGVGIELLTKQRAQYFGVESGILVNNVCPDSPASQAGLKAGDVIVGIDSEPVRGPLGLIRIIDDKKESDFSLKIVRYRKEQSVSFHIDKNYDSP